MDLSAIIQALSRKPADARPLVLMDFDGTLVELRDSPEAVELPAGRRELLWSMGHRSGLTMGVISGRRLADLRSRVGAGDSVYYSGLHGLEIEGPGLSFLHADAQRTRPLIERLARSLDDATKDLVGVYVENKDLAVAMHVRGAAPALQRRAEQSFREIAAPHVEAGTLRVLNGNRVFELLPALAWTKGDAVLRIRTQVERQHGQPAWLIYIGDDVTDEDAFRAVGEGGLTIAVGYRPAPAAFRLSNPDAVEQFLRAFAISGS